MIFALGASTHKANFIWLGENPSSFHWVCYSDEKLQSITSCRSVHCFTHWPLFLSSHSLSWQMIRGPGSFECERICSQGHHVLNKTTRFFTSTIKVIDMIRYDKSFIYLIFKCFHWEKKTQIADIFISLMVMFILTDILGLPIWFLCVEKYFVTQPSEYIRVDISHANTWTL